MTELICDSCKHYKEAVAVSRPKMIRDLMSFYRCEEGIDWLIGNECLSYEAKE